MKEKFKEVKYKDPKTGKMVSKKIRYIDLEEIKEMKKQEYKIENFGFSNPFIDRLLSM